MDCAFLTNDVVCTAASKLATDSIISRARELNEA
jgi:hypothetical protein